MRIQPVYPLLVVATLSLVACDALDELFATEDVAAVISVDDLTGKAVEFHSPENAQTTGGHSRWQYSFVSDGELVGCNDQTSYQATDWFPVGQNTVRVAFGVHWEEYTFLTGGWNEGGSFEISTSVGSNARGTFRQVSSLSLGGCP